MAMHRLLCMTCSLAAGVHAYQRTHTPGDTPHGQAARVWPPPSSFSVSNNTEVLMVDPCEFEFKTTGEEATRGVHTHSAFAIYRPLVLRGKRCRKGAARLAVEGGARLLSALEIRVVQRSEGGSDEAYALSIDSGGAVLEVNSYIGTLRGLETFSQLAQHASAAPALLQVPAYVRLRDSPSFKHRGVLLDTARNFIPIANVKRIVDGLMYSKMNVLHLHLSDSQSFPIELTTGHGPNITYNGAYSANETYTKADVADLLAYAKTRGVELIPEIDTPGHARAFGLTPGLEGIVTCADVVGAKYTTCCKEPPCGQLNPASELMYSVLSDALGDLAGMFPDTDYVHLGFDEVNDNCWTSDASVAAYLKEHNLTPQGLLNQFFLRERKMLPKGKSAIYWDEIVSAGIHQQLQPTDVIQFWHDSDSGLIQKYFKDTPTTNTAVISMYNDYYLDCGTGNEFGDASWCDPFKTWRTIYFNDFLKGVAAEHYSRVLGGEVTLWTEVASAGSIESKMWPRASAYGGRLWNYKAGATANWVDVELGLAALSSQMLERGVQADQIMPEFCQNEPHMCFPGK